jgi:hypothetical protein
MNFYYGPTGKKPNYWLGWMYAVGAVKAAYQIYKQPDLGSLYAGLAGLGVFWSYRNFRDAGRPAGFWIGITSVPDYGAVEVTLEITKSADGYGGTMSDSLGLVAKETLRDVQFAAGVLKFGFSLTDGALMKMTLTLSGDKMAGEWEMPDGEFGNIAFEQKKL